MARERAKLIITGVVQGVGFRPFIYQLAQAHGLSGWVLNSSRGVIIEVEGTAPALAAFSSAIESKAPPRAAIESIEREKLPATGETGFTIRESREEPGRFQLISPDISVCDDCLTELFDLRDRRHRYPFINCTNCGPRFTIIEDIPYDRPKTTMKKFKMCPDCQAEYDDPMNRRFHAQPNACPTCGPQLEFVVRSSELGDQGDTEHRTPNSEPLSLTVGALKAGKIVAIKGLGGFHLACDAENDTAVKTLRTRKRRYGKPLAVMMADLEQVARHCHVDKAEQAALSSPQRPIVLLKKRAGSGISDEVAPNNKYLGVMLPYTPAHYLILRDSQMVLVMTSGNLSEEPIAAENEEALRRLGHIADAFLLHNRDIYSRYDDPVVRVTDGATEMIRRARSYAPYPIHLPVAVRRPILAVGGELKSTFTLARDSFAFVSQHIGDMENAETLEHFENTLELYQHLFRVEPEVVAHDLHPEYFSTKFALGLAGVEQVGVQHHHAHVVSCMVENGVKEPVIGVSFDGTGYGTDGTIWGGEFLVSTWREFDRAGYLRPVKLPGGDVAVEKPYRMAFSYLCEFFGDDCEKLGIDYLKRFDPVEKEIVKKQVETGLLSPLTSSAGRLFDAVSSLIGVRDEIEFEGQAAIDLETLADEKETGSYPFGVRAEEQKSRRAEAELVVDTEPIIRAIVEDLRKGVAVPVISAKFHNTVVEFICQVCDRLREATGIGRVALSGGVFQNVFLTTRLTRRLVERGFEVLSHRLVPANDGGISLGQAIIANERKD